MRNLIAIMMAVSLFGCSSTKKPLRVVDHVDFNRYVGTWYEIARLPNNFEKGLKCITATYSMRPDGKIKVLNQGHYTGDTDHKVSRATGVAWIPDKNVQAKLRVRFFWPFSGKYWILDLDKDYQYVLVGEPSRKYLWVLSRTPQLDITTYNQLIAEAHEMGFPVENMIKVEQGCNN